MRTCGQDPLLGDAPRAAAGDGVIYRSLAVGLHSQFSRRIDWLHLEW
jgi:hypothetical protein